MRLNFAFIRKVSLLITCLFLIEAAQAKTASFDVISYDAQIEPDISGKTIKIIGSPRPVISTLNDGCFVSFEVF